MNNSNLTAIYTHFIYTSSAVEGISLKKSEVEDIVLKGINAKCLQINPSEHVLQAYGQKLALDQIEKWAKNKKTVTIKQLLELHYITFNKVLSKAGNYRDHHVRLTSSALIPSFPYSIQADMRDLNDWLSKRQKAIKKSDLNEVVEFVARTYHKINRIHPFEDGNGRTARLFINLILRKYELPYIFIPKSNKIQLMKQTLRDADKGDIKPLINFFEKLLKTSMKMVNR
jgi:fido (protein-threonine AMPylation protein)